MDDRTSGKSRPHRNDVTVVQDGRGNRSRVSVSGDTNHYYGGGGDNRGVVDTLIDQLVEALMGSRAVQCAAVAAVLVYGTFGLSALASGCSANEAGLAFQTSLFRLMSGDVRGVAATVGSEITACGSRPWAFSLTWILVWVLGGVLALWAKRTAR